MITKNTRFLFTAVACCIIATFYTSCHKSPAHSTITFYNNTYTPISITVNSSATQVIPVNSSIVVVGNPGEAANVQAATYGATTSGTQVGELISWSFADNFPGGGSNLDEPLNVDASYFYLFVVNTSGFATASLLVNYGLTAQTTDNIVIPSDGTTYGVGYYLGFANTQVDAILSNSAAYITPDLVIPNAANASATAYIQ